VAVKQPRDVSVFTADQVVGEVIDQSYGYVSSTCLGFFVFNKASTIEMSLDWAFNKIQSQAFSVGADAIISVRTSLETQSQYWFFTRVNVFMEGTAVTFKSSD
jgi:hypothetical protein